jgi:hypothetical protein
MRRLPWDILLALLAGLGLGLAYVWLIAPRQLTEANPAALRADFQDQYRSVIAAAYAATGNLPRARARLALLGDGDSVEALNAQAQRMLASGEQFEHVDQVVALASALSVEQNGARISTPTTGIISQPETDSTFASPPPVTEVEVELTETPDIGETPDAIQTELAGTGIASTPRPPRTPTPSPGEPFSLTGQETVCDPNLPDGLLQVLVLNSSRRQLSGMEIDITWAGGEEQFFTGLKPELGNGYADYLMAPETAYSVQLAGGSDIALDIIAPICQGEGGETFLGSIKLTFQQP